MLARVWKVGATESYLMSVVSGIFFYNANILHIVYGNVNIFDTLNFVSCF